MSCDDIQRILEFEKAHDPATSASLEDQYHALGVSSIFSLAAILYLMTTIRSRGLLTDSIGFLLLGYTLIFGVFNVICIFDWMYPLQLSDPGCEIRSFLKYVGLLGGPCYFVVLAWHLWNLASNPFASGKRALGKHFLAISCTLIASAALLELRPIPWVVLHGLDDCPQSSFHAGMRLQNKAHAYCPEVFLYSWDLYEAVRVIYAPGFVVMFVALWYFHTYVNVKGKEQVSQRKVDTVKRFFWILVWNALMQLAIPTCIVKARVGGMSLDIVECIMNAIAPCVCVFAWLSVDCFYAEKEYQPGSDQSELSETLRMQIVDNIKKIIVYSAQSKDESDLQHPKFTEVCLTAVKPAVFTAIRESYSVKPEDYKASIEQAVTEIKTEGKSDAFFYFTADKRFMIKTATDEDYNQLLKILPRYQEYVKDNPKTLINAIVGAYNMNFVRQTVHVIVIQSVFWLKRTQQNFEPVDERYDLKGSWIGRQTKVQHKLTDKEPLPFLNPKKSKQCKKDKDIYEPLLLREDLARDIAVQLVRDSDFLASENIMDYSLLLGVKFKNQEVARPADPDDLHCVSAMEVSGPSEYCFGIIDILQPYSCRKILEHNFYKLRCRAKGSSCVPPRKYAERFQKMIAKGLICPNLQPSDYQGMGETLLT